MRRRGDGWAPVLAQLRAKGLDVDAMLAAQRRPVVTQAIPSAAAPAIAPGPAVTTAAPPRPRMNKTEARWEARLAARRAAGEILVFRFEAITLLLGEGVRYTPDFLVVYPDALGFDEVKGAYVREDARVKFRCAVEQYPWFRWRWAQWVRGEWIERQHGIAWTEAATCPG